MAPNDRDRFDQLAPRDVAITLRSMRRRFGSVGTRAIDPSLAPVIDRAGPSGHRLDDLLATAVRGTALVTNALEQSLTSTDPVLPPAVFDPSERTFVDERPIGIDQSIQAISDEADAAADRIEAATAGELSRQVAVAGGDATTPLAIGQQLARELVEALTLGERHVEWLESQI